MINISLKEYLPLQYSNSRFTSLPVFFSFIIQTFDQFSYPKESKNLALCDTCNPPSEIVLGVHYKSRVGFLLLMLPCTLNLPIIWPSFRQNQNTYLLV